MPPELKELLILECQNRWALFRLLKPKQYTANLRYHIKDLENEREQTLQQQQKAYSNDAFLYDLSLERINQQLAHYRGLLSRHAWSWPNKPPGGRQTENFITDAQVQAAKSVSIETYYPGTLRRVGQRRIGKCPFHDERTGSFKIFEDNRGHCFGCGWDGDVIDFVSKLNNLKFLEAVRFIIKNHSQN